MSAISANDSIRNAVLSEYCCATVFSQETSAPHLFVVNFNATERDVRSTQGDWRVLTFDHIPQPNSINRKYSAVSHLGREEHIAAYGSPHWIPQLLPDVYNYREFDDEGNPIPPSTISAGLTGNLAVLLALAAFSAVPSSLDAALTGSVRPRAYVPHTMSTGREYGLLPAMTF